MKLVTDIKDAKYITHSGTMHTDEVFATAFLDLYKKDIAVIRVPQIEKDKIPKGALIYDIGRGKYDHHQEDAELRENGIKYSSFGLLFRDFGKDYLKKLNIEEIEEVFNTIDKELIEGIDAVDNGVFPEINANFKIKTLDDIIKVCNPSFGSTQDENEQFIKAVELAKIIFQEILYNIQGKVKAKKIILEKLKNTTKDYLELEEYIPYEETVIKNEEGNHILFALYPSNRGGWGIKTIKKSSEDKTDRCPFPEAWAGLENEELEEKTGIKGLKVGFNKVFGYFLEVTKSNLNMVPERYIRKQTLTNAERFITEELKNLENQILGAEEKVVNLEYDAFVEIREEIAKNIVRLQQTSEVVSTLDVLASFATVAEDMNYCMPEVNTLGVIDIKDGRHPVIEKILGAGSFVENDTYLDKGENRLSIITGPNMAGKSTYMRQVALITLMAQVGSFVPASSAKIGVVDKIFTRVGASDDLSMGQSTFMVEMMEVATILKEATPNSLVILDEIGRGTSTYDGLSIAWAVAEYIADKEKCGAKTLFATHYHELIELEGKIEGVKNYSVAVKEKGEDIIFLRKIVKGGTDESYGIHVARLAGVPKVVTTKANEILRSLERKNILTGKKQEKQDKKQVEGQFDMFNYKLAEIAHEIDKIDLNELTPIDALNTLVKIKEKMK